MAGYRTNVPRRFTLCVWTVTEKEQEELGSGEDSQEGKTHQRFLLTVPLCHWITVDQLHQFSARNVPGLGRNTLSHLAASWPCPTSSAQFTDPIPRLLGKEAPRRAGGPTVARAAALLQPGTWDNIPFPLQHLWPFPKGCVCLDYPSWRTSPCRARSEEPRTAQRC